MINSPWAAIGAAIWALEQRSPTGTIMLMGALVAAGFAWYAPAALGTWLLLGVAALFASAALWMFLRGE